MMTGSVNATLEPTIHIEVRDAMGQAHVFLAKIDTGYDGSLSLPLQQIQALRLAWVDFVVATLADGSTRRINVYEATVIWNGQPRLVEVDAAYSTPLIGTGLLERHRVTIDMIPGGTVTIDPIP
jgi:clan AA aspartic protease